MISKIAMFFAVIAIGIILGLLVTQSTGIGQLRIWPGESCSDTDGGNIPKVKGTVSGFYFNGRQFSLTDSCINTTFLKEYYCIGSEPDNVRKNCNDYGYAWNCSNGKCYNSTPTTIPNSCSDTDGGYNGTVKGSLTGYNSGLPYTYTDYCSDSTTVREYYCVGTTPASSGLSCLSIGYLSCSNGVCTMTTTTTTLPNATTTTTTIPTTTTTVATTTTTIPNSCSDTDGGRNYTVTGTVSGYYGGLPYNYTDFCNSTSVLTEYFCIAQYWKYSNITCGVNGTGTTCSNGKCL
jgi:hypothetical protein